MNVRRMVLLALLVAIATVLSYIESLLPPLVAALPGVKLGLANVCSVFALYRLRRRDALAVVLVRCLLVAVLFGSPVSLLYSVAGGLLSLGGMLLVRRCDRWFSIFGASIAGAVLHHVGQLAVAGVFLGSPAVFYMLPYMTLLALPTGAFVGAMAQLAGNALDKSGALRGVV